MANLRNHRCIAWMRWSLLLLGAGIPFVRAQAQPEEPAEASVATVSSRPVAVVAEARTGLAIRDPLSEDQEIRYAGLDVGGEWAQTAGLRAGLILRKSVLAMADFRILLDYDTSLGWRVEEEDPAGDVATKRSRWQIVGVGIAPRWAGSFKFGHWGLSPHVAYRLRTWFSPVFAAIPNHARHGVFAAAALGWSNPGGQLELSAQPQLEFMLPDAALKRRSEGVSRLAGGVDVQLHVRVHGPLRLGVRWSEMVGFGDTKFAERILQLSLSFNPGGLTR